MMKQKLTDLFLSALAMLGLATTSSSAAIIVATDPTHLISGSVTGTLVAIDVPVLNTSVTYSSGSPGGPSWTTGGGIIAHPADQGFFLRSRPGDDYTSRAGFVWEPDGTPLAEARSYGAYNSGDNPEVQYIFNLTNSGIDLPDGSVINGIYTTWKRRNDTADYRYTEGAASDTVGFSFGAAPTNDLTLRWYDDTATGHDAEFQRIFSGPITVEGGDGFTLQQFRQANTAHIEAVILDVTFVAVPEPSSTVLLGLGGIAMMLRRRR